MARKSMLKTEGQRSVAVTPTHGWHNLDYLMQRGLADIRATQGLVNGLHRLFVIRLDQDEAYLAMLKNTSSDDAAVRYQQQLRRTEDMRTCVAMLAALLARSDVAESTTAEAARRVGRALRKLERATSGGAR